MDNLFDEIDKNAAPGAPAGAVDTAPAPAPAPEPAPVAAAEPAPAPAPASGVVVVPPDAPPPSFIEPKADLIIGATGTGKTVNIGEVADYIFAKYGLLSRLASTDPSGAGPLQGKVKAGMIEFWAPQAWPKPIEAMWRSTMGWWPLRADDPTSPLVPPDAGTYEVYGFQGFEGLTSYGDTIIEDLKKNNASLSQDPSYKWAQGEFTASGGNQSYYGMMQDTLKMWVNNTHLLRYKKVLWTALESKGKDQFGNMQGGPMIGGKQATTKAGQWFVNFVHIDTVAGQEKLDPTTKQKLIEVQHVLFLKPHVDPLSMVPFPCKIRAPKKYKDQIPAVIMDGNLVEAYKILDALYEKEMAEASAQMDSVAGLREKLMERAAKARKAEAEAAEKRAKGMGVFRGTVAVPGPVSVPGPAVAAVQPAAPPAKPATPMSSPTVTGPSVPKAPALPAMPTSIQNVRKGK